jgi:hypothetical protein
MLIVVEFVYRDRDRLDQGSARDKAHLQSSRQFDGRGHGVCLGEREREGET